MKITIKNDKVENLDEIVPKKQRSKKRIVEHTELDGQKNTLPYLLYFFVVVLVCILLSLVARFFFTMKDSTFVTPSYSMMVASNNPFLVVINTETKKLFLIDLDTKTSSKMVDSIAYKIPIDGKIITKDSGVNSQSFPKVSYLMKFLFRPWEYRYEGMTSLDAVKLTQTALGISKKDIERFTISVSKGGDVSGITQDTLYDVFKDTLIINDQQSIEVVNATSQEGLAGGVGQVIKNVGGNVVSVASANNIKKSTLKAAIKSQTLIRLSHILDLEPEIDENFSSISDIQIILGESFLSKLK